VQTLHSFHDAAESVRKLLGPQSGLGEEALRTLQQVTETAESLQQLADFLERNPNALITGKRRPARNPKPARPSMTQLPSHNMQLIRTTESSPLEFRENSQRRALMESKAGQASRAARLSWALRFGFLRFGRLYFIAAQADPTRFYVLTVQSARPQEPMKAS